MAGASMAGRTKTFGVSEYCVRVKIFPNDTGTATYSSQGGVASVVRSAAGKFTITFTNAWLSCVEANVSYSTSADNVDLYAQMGAFANLGTTTAATAVVKLKTGSTNTDGAATATDNFISCCFVFEDSSA